MGLLHQLGALLCIATMSGCVYSAPKQSQDNQHVYIFAGQSNMAGRGETRLLPNFYKKTPHNVTFYYQGRKRDLARNTFFGPEVSFAHAIARAYPQQQHIIIKQAASGSSIQQWLPNQGLYKGLMRQYSWLKSKKPLKIDALFWMQGERDSRHKSQAVQYEARLKRLIQGMRFQLNSPHSWFIMGKVNPKPAVFKMKTLVQKAQRKVKQALPHTLLVDTDGLSTQQDHIHYDTQGQLELGKRFAKAFILHEQQRRLRHRKIN